MTVQFDLHKLKNLYIETLESFDKSLAFDIEVNRGRFLLMMFLSEEDKESKDMLFLYMRNTRVMKPIKLYGNHIKGTFMVYINKDLQDCIINELQLKNTNGKFNFMNFLEEFNKSIPQTININDKIKNLRNNRQIITGLNGIDDINKTVLIGPRKLTVGTPQDKTLRKLYLYTNTDAEEITLLIKILKRMNMTTAWTTEDGRYKEANIRKMINDLQ